MRNYLFEIYTDEIPSYLVNIGVQKLKENFQNALKNYKLHYDEIESYSTSHRLVIFIKNVSEKEEDTSGEVKGPAYVFAYSESGEPLVALTKFMQANSLNESEIYSKEVKRIKYVFAKKLIKGHDAREILKEVSQKAVLDLKFPRSMRWDVSNFEFIRPIKNILSIFGDELIDVSIGNLSSSSRTFGFSFDVPFVIELRNSDEYMRKLKENYVVVSYNDRKRIVEKRSLEIAKNASGVPLYDDDFFESVVNLNEYPVPFLCDLEMSNLNIPDCIVESVVKNHMKAFPIMDPSTKKLLPYFIAVKNGPSDFIDIVRKGYERVAKARLLDGLFFYEEDQRVSLESLVRNLSEVLFMKDLGSILDKTNRMVKLSERIAGMISLEKDEKDDLVHSSFLSKADLLTNVVKEFPELQGTIGGIYAKNQGKNDAVSLALAEQYLPRFQGDILPSSRLGKLLSFIDRVDTLTGSIMLGISFSSSKDPFGLKRVASGIVQILNSLNLNYFPVYELIKTSVDLFIDFNPKFTDKTDEIVTIIKDRALYYLKDNGIRYDVANAVISLPIDVLSSYLTRSNLLMKQLNTDKLEIICQSHKRVTNILGSTNEVERAVDKSLLFDKNELELYEAIEESEKLFKELVNKNDFEAVIQMLYLITPLITKVFDNILIMDNDERIRKNRLALLKRLKSLLDGFANFSEIVFEK
jgi:glycyl-tRNA synthetase beta chain